MIYNLSEFCFSVLTPYFKEDVLYSGEDLNKENEDGISILFYLTKIYLGEYFYMLSFIFPLFSTCSLIHYLTLIERNDVLLVSFDPSVLHRICRRQWLFLYLHIVFKFKS
ncbi:putative callose synthase 6, partial [Mucuna pruriens]